MPNDKLNPQPDADIKGPTPPSDPVNFARWVQRPRIRPKAPKVQPNDSAMLPAPLEKPEVNRSIGTDKPKQPKRKNPNNTRLPGYLKPNDGLKSAPVAKNGGSLREFIHWFDVTIGDSLDLRKMSPATLAAFGLGWFVSDSLTRDEKQAYQRHLENEFERTIKNQDDAKKARQLERSGRRLKKSAFDELQEFYQGRMA